MKDKQKHKNSVAVIVADPQTPLTRGTYWEFAAGRYSHIL